MLIKLNGHLINTNLIYDIEMFSSVKPRESYIIIRQLGQEKAIVLYFDNINSFFVGSKQLIDLLKHHNELIEVEIQLK